MTDERRRDELEGKFTFRAFLCSTAAATDFSKIGSFVGGS